MNRFCLLPLLSVLLLSPACVKRSDPPPPPPPAPAPVKPAAPPPPPPAPVAPEKVDLEAIHGKRLIGATVEELTEFKGEGEVVAEQGDSLVLKYPDSTYTLKEGKVVSSRATPASKGKPRVTQTTAVRRERAIPAAVAAPEQPRQTTPDDIMRRYRYQVESKAAEWANELRSRSSSWYDWYYTSCDVNNCTASNGWVNRYTMTGTVVMRRGGTKREQGFEAYVQLDDNGGLKNIEIMTRN